MKSASIAEVSDRPADYLADAARGPVVILDEGRPVAALVAISDADDAERLALAFSPALGQLLAARAEEVRRTGGLSHEEFWRQVEERYGDGDAVAGDDEG